MSGGDDPPGMSLAAEAREAARARPFLLTALRAGVVNYSAAAAFLGLDERGDREAAATALRRFAEDLPAYREDDRDVRVRVERGVGRADGDDAPLFRVGDAGFAPDAGALTALVATGDVDGRALAAVLARLDAAGGTVEAAGVGDGTLAVVVGGRGGASALRPVEDALSSVPSP